MFVYFGKRFDSAQVRATVVGVKCEKCSCDYYYELARIGAGSSSAPYGIGAADAAREAQQISENELQNRLASEAELVPCPKCNWINDEIVKGYRRGQYQGFTKPTVVITIIGTASALLCAWPISQGAQLDRWLLPYLLFGGPAMFGSFAMSMFLLRTWLRSLIRPNRYYPRAPKLPPGSPPALFLDPSSEELRPAKLDQPHGNSADGWQDCQVGRTLFPLQFCECLKPTTTEHPFAIPVSGQINLEIPWCGACSRKYDRTLRGGWLILVAIGLLAGGMTLAIWKLDAGYTCVANFVLLVLFFAAVGLIVYFGSATRTGPAEAVVVDQSRGVVRLRFRNLEYARLVAKQTKENHETAGPNATAEDSTAFKE